MIDVKEAVTVAFNFFNSLYNNDRRVSNLHLEEVELSEDGKYWLITLSYLHEQPHLSTINPLSTINSPWQNPPRQTNKEYKLFRINAETGEPKAMKIRQVA